MISFRISLFLAVLTFAFTNAQYCYPFCDQFQTCLYDNSSNSVCVDNSVIQLHCVGCDTYVENAACIAIPINDSTCICRYGGVYPSCANYTYQCGSYACQGFENCLYDPITSQNLCVDSNLANTECQFCSQNEASCVGVFGNPNTARCDCYYNGTYPNCLGQPCNGINCQATIESCYYTQSGTPVCINIQNYNDICYNCSMLAGGACDYNSAGDIFCKCSQSGVYPSCSGPICGGTSCSLSESCFNDYCYNTNDFNNFCYFTCGYSQGVSCTLELNQTTLLPEPACNCSIGGTYPNCYSQQCGSQFCSQNELCYYYSTDSVCVDSNYYYTTCNNCSYTPNSQCALTSISPVTLQCECSYGGISPNCNGYPCGSGYCSTNENCFYFSNSQGCFNYSYYDSVCNNCTYQSNQQCSIDPLSPSTLLCSCSYGETNGVCNGQPCGSSFCSSNEMCIYGSNTVLCVDSNTYSSVCNNCSYQLNQHCEGVAGTPNTVACVCNYGGTPPNCDGPPCGQGFCQADEYCIQTSFYNNNNNNNNIYTDPICVNSMLMSQFCMCDYNSGSTCIGVAGQNGTANNVTCACIYDKDPVTGICLGQICGNSHCNFSQNCLLNSVPNGIDLCVDNQNMFCSACNNYDSDKECRSVVGIDANFAQCFCKKASLTNPNVCIPAYCGGQYCLGDFQVCQNDSFGGQQCICTDGYSMSDLSRRCEIAPIFAQCVPCSVAVAGQACGCPATQICESVSDADLFGRCTCAPDYVANPGIDDSSIVCAPKSKRPDSSRATCIASGDPHFMSFDTRFFDFQGRCDYVLTRGNGLEVHIRTGECFSNYPVVSCTKAVAFNAGNDVVEFDENGAKLNGFVATLPFTANGVLISALLMQGEYSATFADGVVIQFRRFYVSVNVTSDYFNVMEGLCGNFDGTATNDLKLRDNSQALTPVTFGEDWAVKLTDTVLFSTNNTECGVTPLVSTDPYGFCNENSEMLRDAQQYCNFDKFLLQDCWQFFDLAKVYAACIYDYCHLQNLTIEWPNVARNICAGEIMDRKPPMPCDPPCTSTQTCVLVASNNSQICISNQTTVDPCSGACSVRQDCLVSINNAGQQVGRCVCKTGFVTDPLVPSKCNLPGECGDILCTKQNEQCSSIQVADGSIKFSCECINGTARNILTGDCESTQEAGVLGGCVVCQATVTQTCGCSNENFTCVSPNNGPIGRCVCKKGFSLDQVTGGCIEQVIIPVPVPSICQAFGDPHYSTFDNAHYDYQAKCDVYFIRSTSLTVQVRQSECWPQFGGNSWVSCAKGVAFNTPNGDIVEFNDELAAFTPNVDVEPRVFVNGALISSSATVDGVAINVSPSSLEATFANGVIITLSRYFSLSIFAPAILRNTISGGICGNFNGNPDDDDTRGYPYLVNGTSFFTTNNSYCSSSNTKRQQNSGSSDPNCAIKALTACAPLLTIGDTFPYCSALADMTDFYLACIFDYCNLGDAVPMIVESTINAATKLCTVQTQIYQQFVDPSISTTGGGSLTTTGSLTTATSQATTGGSAVSTASIESANLFFLVTVFFAIFAIFA